MNQLLVPGHFNSMPKAIQSSTVLTSDEKIVYVALLNHLGDNEDCWPSQATLASECGIDRRATISKCIRNLEVLGFIRVVRRRSGNSHFSVNHYFLNDQSQWATDRPASKRGERGRVPCTGEQHGNRVPGSSTAAVPGSSMDDTGEQHGGSTGEQQKPTGLKQPKKQPRGQPTQRQAGRESSESKLVAAIEARLGMKKSKMSDEQIAQTLAAISKEAALRLADLITALATFKNLEEFAIGTILASSAMRRDLIDRAVDAAAARRNKEKQAAEAEFYKTEEGKAQLERLPVAMLRVLAWSRVVSSGRGGDALKALHVWRLWLVGTRPDPFGQEIPLIDLDALDHAAAGGVRSVEAPFCADE
jgi:hypothetical protein